MRSFTVMASASLVQSTRVRVHARAQQLRERQSRLFLMAISFAMGVVFSTLSAWVWWKVGGWMVEQWSLPASIIGPGVVLAWLLPSICLGVLLVERGRPADAVHWFERAIAATPDLVEARLNLGIALQQSGQPVRAAEIYRQVLAAPARFTRERDAAAKLLAALRDSR